MNAVWIKHLSVHFGNLLIIDDVSLNVEDKEVVALVGPSGCGKSTLLRVVAGVIPDMILARIEGEISVFGHKPKDIRPGEVDMMFQEGNLLPWRNAIRNVELGPEIIRNNKPTFLPKQLLERIGLGGFTNTRPGKLSGGMRQRVSLASTLITNSKLILMDEPLANLDALTRESMWQLIESLKQSGLISTALLVTHSIEEAVVLSDRVYVMSERPGTIKKEIKVGLSKPRISSEGLFVDGFGSVANEIRAIIRTGGRQ